MPPTISYQINRDADVYVALVAALAELNNASATLSDADPNVNIIRALASGAETMVNRYGIALAECLRAVASESADVSPLVAWSPARVVTHDTDLSLPDLLRLQRTAEALATDAAARRDGAALERWQRVAQRYADLFELRSIDAAVTRTPANAERSRGIVLTLLASRGHTDADALALEQGPDADADPDTDADPDGFMIDDPDPDPDTDPNADPDLDGDVWFIAPEWAWYRTLVTAWRYTYVALLAVVDADAMEPHVVDDVELAMSTVAGMVARQPHYGTSEASDLGYTDEPDSIPADLLATRDNAADAVASAIERLALAFDVAPFADCDDINYALVYLRAASIAMASA